MDRYLTRKRPKLSSPSPSTAREAEPLNNSGDLDDADESTDVKLAVLASLFPQIEQDYLLESLILHDGSIDAACAALSDQTFPRKKRLTHASLGVQSSLSSYGVSGPSALTDTGSTRNLTKKGKTLHLYSADDVARYTPCSIIHNFLPAEEANELLRELLQEAETFERQKFQLFENVVESPHTAGFYVSSSEEQRQQQSEYSYNGRFRKDVRQLTPVLRRVSAKVQDAVNEEIRKRIETRYPDGKKLKYQSPRPWAPNAAFVNCYDGPAESVGYHSDELTYLGPRAVIGSLSLGVSREFRVRRIIPPDEEPETNTSKGVVDKNSIIEGSPKKSSASSKLGPSRADVQGQIAIHLPHNSLLVMHAEMQEEWKHSISPAQTISPHPISGSKRINVTYRWYRDSLHPRYTPRCRCGMPCVLRCVQRKKENRGRYMWMCYAGYSPGKESCSFFQWADFDEDGEPIWNKGKDTHDKRI